MEGKETEKVRLGVARARNSPKLLDFCVDEVQVTEPGTEVNSAFDFHSFNTFSKS